MFDQEARLTRLLSRHHDAAVVAPAPGRIALVRRYQLLAAERDASAVEDRVRRWFDSREVRPGVTRIRLRAPSKVDVCELVAQLNGSGGHRKISVSPNHILHSQPLWWSGSADLPRPSPPLPAPVAGRPPRRAVTVAVLDTGLSPHPWYEATEWYAAQRDSVTEAPDTDPDSHAGHGTFVAGVILQHAPTAVIAAHRVLGSDGVGDELDLTHALTTLAKTSDADIVNISSGCHTYDDRPSPVVAQALAALGRGTVIIACAGNTASDRPFWPAAAKNVIAVAALDKQGRDRAWFSNYGWWVDAAAPGTEVRSCFLTFNGSRPRVNDGDPDDFAGYATWSGTSFAAPAVAGAVARLMAQDDIPSAVAAERVLASAATHPDLGVIIRT